MKIEKLKKAVSSYEETVNEVLEIIGYGSSYFQELTILENAKWEVASDNLTIFGLYDDEPDEEYSFIISSYSAKGEKQYIGTSEGYTYIMGYDDNYGWENTEIYVLKNSNEIK